MAAKRIGPNRDVGWVEYLLFENNSNPFLVSNLLGCLHEPSSTLFREALNEYISAVKSVLGNVLELMAEGLEIKPSNTFSKLVMSNSSDLMFTLNHYPKCSQWIKEHKNRCLTGFGEHTDPQIISILRSNSLNGYQIALKNGCWVSIPSDEGALFVNCGDTSVPLR